MRQIWIYNGSGKKNTIVSSAIIISVYILLPPLARYIVYKPQMSALIIITPKPALHAWLNLRPHFSTGIRSSTLCPSLPSSSVPHPYQYTPSSDNHSTMARILFSSKLRTEPEKHLEPHRCALHTTSMDKGTEALIGLKA
jgi:hypothetical protein